MVSMFLFRVRRQLPSNELKNVAESVGDTSEFRSFTICDDLGDELSYVQIAAVEYMHMDIYREWTGRIANSTVVRA
jgi:hypothetical protein